MGGVKGRTVQRKRSMLAVMAASAAVALVLASGCGSNKTTTGSSASSMEVWANGICSALTTWTSSLASIGSSVKSGGQGVSNATLRQSAGKVETANETLLNDLRALGKPPTAEGSQAKAEVSQLSTELTNETGKVKSATENVSGAGSVSSAVSVVSSTLVSMEQAVSSTVTQLQSLRQGSFKQAFSQASACKSLTSH
jgi:hypothetical protein